MGGLISQAQPATAACSPEPPIANGQTICDGADTDGLTIDQNGVAVVVSARATVGARPDGLGALVLQRPTGQAIAGLTNDGTISSSQGFAVNAVGNTQSQAFGRITNKAGGIIAGSAGAIHVVVGRLDNAGLIDGGNGSAYSFAPSAGSPISPEAIVNSGVMRSNSTSATIDLPFGSPQQFLNSGQIINTGTGLVYRTNESIVLVNDKTGIISTAGPVALQSDFGMVIRNSGTINGSIVGGSSTDLVDTRTGMVNGNVSLGDGNDRLIAAMGQGTLVGGISGTIDGGSGQDILELIVSTNRIVGNSALPSGFEQLQLNLESNATITLTASQAPAGGFAIRGTGSLVTTSDINQVGPIITGQITQQNLGPEKLSFTNSGNLTAQLSQPLLSAVTLENLDAVTNEGLISGINGGGAYFRLNYEGSATNNGTIRADNTALSVLGSLTNNGLIQSTAGVALSNDLGGGVVRGKTSLNNGTIIGSTAGASLSSLILINTGSISATSGVGIQSYSSTIDNRQGGVIAGSVAGIGNSSNAIVLNAGIINGGVDFTTGGQSSADIFVDRGGVVNGNVRLGGGNDIFIADLDRGLNGVTGLVDGGDGTDTLRWRVDSASSAAATLAPTFERLGFELESGASLVVPASAQPLQAIEFTGTGTVDLAQDITGSGGPMLNLTASPVARLLDPLAPLSGHLEVVSRGSLTYSLVANNLQGELAAVYASTFINSPFFVDTRTVSFENAGTITATGLGPNLVTPFAIMGGTEIVNSGLIELSAAIGVGRADALINTGTIRQTASGIRSFGVFDVPSVTNTGIIDTQGTAVAYEGVFVFPNPRISVENSGLIVSRSDVAIRLSSYALTATVRNARGASISGLTNSMILNGSVDVDNEGTIDGDVLIGLDGYSSGSSFENSGIVNGDVAFGGGNDRFTYRSGSVVNGSIGGGQGVDTLAFRLTGTDGIPDILDLAPYQSFEQLEIEQGTGRVEGAAAFQRVTITSGRLIGAPGSALTANLFTVAQDGKFGSAGTVNGDIAVSGTLSPGASPGTMIINGNVALAAGSTTLFEMTPVVSDAIRIDGTLTIAEGATLRLSGTRPLTPGTAYDLITASDGITGSFSTIDKASTVLGFIQQDDDSIQLLGQFLLAPEGGIDLQAGRVIDQLNLLLVEGFASDGIIEAIPHLLDAQGFGDTAKLRQLSAEAYASASQIGVETGLMLASAARTINIADGRSQAGPFTFGQWLGNWRRMPGRDTFGTQRADVHARGIMGGLGFGSETASIGAFVGYVDTTQRISALGARTDSDGIIAGVIGEARLGNFRITAMAARDFSEADTTRVLPGGSAADSSYDMHGWVIDANLGYAIDAGNGWGLTPQVGITYIRNSRDSVAENGQSPLRLVVDGHRTEATFISGQMMLRGDPDLPIQPWLSAGVRHQTSGNLQTVSAAFAGTISGFSVPGAPRDRTQATLDGGVNATLSSFATLFFGLRSEFGSDSTGRSANAGVRMQF